MSFSAQQCMQWPVAGWRQLEWRRVEPGNETGGQAGLDEQCEAFASSFWHMEEKVTRAQQFLACKWSAFIRERQRPPTCTGSEAYAGRVGLICTIEERKLRVQ